MSLDGYRFHNVHDVSYAISRKAGKPPTLRLTLSAEARREDAEALIDALDHPETVDVVVRLLRHVNGNLVDTVTAEIVGPINENAPPLPLGGGDE